MKKVRIITLSTLLTFIIIISSFNVFAIGAATFSTVGASGEAGTIVTVVVKEINNYSPKVGAFNGNLQYDPSKLEVARIDKIVPPVYDPEDPTVILTEGYTLFNVPDITLGTVATFPSGVVPLVNPAQIIDGKTSVSIGATSTTGVFATSATTARTIMSIKFKILPGTQAGDIPLTWTVTTLSDTSNVSLAGSYNSSATTNVTVLPPSVALTGISLNKSTTSLGVNGTETLTVSKLPSNTTDMPTYTWSTTDDTKVTVDQNGLITGKAVGSARITATSSIGTNITAFCDVTVTAPIPLQSITLVGAPDKLAKGDSKTVSVTYNPSNTTDTKAVTWSSSNQSVATVSDDGLVEAKAPGHTTIMATANTSYSPPVSIKSFVSNIFGITQFSEPVTASFDLEVTVPVITILPYTTTPTNQDVIVSALAENGELNATSHTFSANGEFTFVATDSMGNEDTETVIITNIDKTGPADATFELSPTTPTNGSVAVYITYPGDATIKEYATSSNGPWSNYQSSLMFSVNNSTVYARSFDALGNASQVASITITNIDTVKPDPATFSASPATLTNTDVSVTITYPTDVTYKQYKVGMADIWHSYTTPVVVMENATVYARSQDAADNQSDESNIVIDYIDKVAPAIPTMTPNTTYDTKEDIVVTAYYSPDASVKQYKIGSTGTWTSYTTPFSVSANNTAYARCQDAAGNWSSEQSLIIDNIDKTAPAVATFTSSNTNPTNANVSITIDYPSDAAVKEYKIGDGSWMNYLTPISVSANGTVTARSQDAVGNWSNESSITITNIDTTAPVLATLVAAPTAATNGDVTVTITYPSDASVKQYKVGSEGTWMAYTAAVVLNENGTVYARSQDLAGNWSNESSIDVENIDKMAPEVATFVVDPTTATNGNVTVTITYPSDASVKHYKVGSAGTWTVYTAAVVVMANDTVYAKSQDAAGNWSAESSVVVDNIDKTAPVITAKDNDNNPISANGVVIFGKSVSVSSNEETLTVTKNGQAFTVPEDGKIVDIGSYVLSSTDELGNVSTLAFSIVAPAPTATPTATPTTNPTNTNPVTADAMSIFFALFILSGLLGAAFIMLRRRARA